MVLVGTSWATAALGFGFPGAEETSQVMKALDERRSGPLSMTSLAWEPQICNNLVGFGYGREMWCLFLVVFAMFFFWVVWLVGCFGWFCTPNFAGFAFGKIFGFKEDRG